MPVLVLARGRLVVVGIPGAATTRVTTTINVIIVVVKIGST